MESQRTFKTLKSEVDHIFKVIKHLEYDVWYKYQKAVNKLPEKIFYLTTEELLRTYPDLSPKERENKICKDKGCVFLVQIGKRLSNGEVHDNRAPDYDDWELNGDILFWYEPLDCALEISSMGIRVDAKSLESQLEIANCTDRKSLPYHQDVLNNKLPFSIGGGIGQSRLCMLLLKKAHIGEVQASIWPQSMIDKCTENNILIL